MAEVPDTIRQLGVGGLIVYIVLREVFGFLRNRHETRNGKRHNGSGERPVEFWTEAIRTIVREEIRNAFQDFDRRTRPRR